MATNNKCKKILVTGASGFIGSFICETAILNGYETWAAMRTRSSKKWLQSPKINFISLDLCDKSILREQLCNFHFDIIIHAAGATKCLKKEEFEIHNYQCTRNLIEVLEEQKSLPGQFIYMSSLSAIYGSAYGESKLKTENWLKSKYASLEDYKEGKIGFAIFRPTGVYGPREKDYFMMAESIKKHIDFAVGFTPQKLTFVYVQDLVNAIFTAIDKNAMNGLTFNVTDGEVYSSRAFSDLIQKELGVKNVLHITAPLWFLKVISVISEEISKLTGKPSTLNRDKYKIMAQRDWTCDITPLQEILGYEPKWQLPQGVKETIAWYKKENWL